MAPNAAAAAKKEVWATLEFGNGPPIGAPSSSPEKVVIVPAWGWHGKGHSQHQRKT
jgi:hypothetical protein